MKVLIKKIETLSDAKYPDAKLPSDYESVKEVLKENFEEPTVGKKFTLVSLATMFISSPVTEIIDEHTFKTENSIYHWEIL